MKLLVFGRSGQVATEIAQRTSPGLSVVTLSRAEADLSSPDDCAAVIARTDADAVINAAAYTAVDRAETEEALAAVVNGVAPGAMAQAAAARRLPFVHLSTDYVFDGAPAPPRDENAPTAPLSAYGRTKLAGERAVAAAGGAAATLRVSWVFSAHGANFVTTMLRLGATRDRLTVVDDQHGGPTAAADIAGATIAVARTLAAGRGAPGLYHYAGAPAVSWRAFADAIFERRPGPAPVVAPIATADWPTLARRPLNTVLDCRRIEDVFGLPRPDWRPALDAVLKQLQETT